MASTKKSMNLAVSLLMAADLLQAPLSATFSVLPIILVLDMYAQSDVGCRRALRECEEENVGLRREIQECELGVRKLLVQMGKRPGLSCLDEDADMACRKHKGNRDRDAAGAGEHDQ